MPHGRERLRDWIDRSRLTQRAAAELLGIHYTFLSQLLNNDRTPALATAVRIERVTGIPVESWMPTDGDDTAESIATIPAKRKFGKR